ncbi:tripartite tricarboxylate transporter substrate binding protein [Roseococcus sp. SYP-B2431]|uniref:Bug family tripartite tricarboxylate transporter substrate binding protein n=1 Tax=Roseococcus sp. SYP-B2431 TaxID=2496640 RepID=UPI00103B500C|nr:tripartite tricarboxylate transporter substrate binding protein [Roseococcus sp. SYP-B2431]TCH98327.1 tripartite tricarboxylate transporter substrate binding protein [Roseococcus sp. SYP-B2431]
MTRFILGALLLLAGPAAAQDFPNRPLRIISGSAAGGSNDFVARFFAEKIGNIFGQRIVVENRAGVNGVIGAEAVVNSPADGYTAFVCPMSTVTITPQLVGMTMPVDPGVDLGPIAMVGLSSYGLVVRAQSPYRNLADLIADARSRPGQITFASPGVGAAQHLGGELLKQMTGTQMEHVAFRGAAPAMVEILAGRVDFSLTNIADIARQVQGGDLRLLAIADETPSPIFPNAPRVSQTVPGFQVVGWFGLCARRDIPPAAMARWLTAIQQVLASGELRQRLSDGGITPLFEDTETFARRIAADRTNWRQIIQASNIRAE